MSDDYILPYEKRQTLRSIIIGVAVGDALGFPAQFEPRSQRKKYPVVGMGQYISDHGQLQSWSQEITGLWSDDTSLTLCLAESLLNGFNLKDMAEKFLAWLDDGYLSARDLAFDVGLQTTQSLSIVRDILSKRSFELLDNLANDDDEQSNGNGGLMRILPLVLHIEGMALMHQFELIQKCCALTHPHSRSVLCCFLYLKMAEYVIARQDKLAAFLQARKDTLDLMTDLNSTDTEFKALARLLYGDLSKLQEAEIDSSGYVVSSLEASIWCLLTTDTFPEAVLKAVNLGDDADTTAAITGGLAALLYGEESIPAEWIALLKKPELFTLFNPDSMMQ